MTTPGKRTPGARAGTLADTPAGSSAESTRAAQLAASNQSVEDYLERIHELIEERGYARPIEIAAALGIRQSSVTKMMQRLHERGYANYAKHRGLTLTLAGERVALQIRRRHRTISEFLRLLGVQEKSLQRDTEGMEHHISAQTMTRLETFLAFLQENPDVVERYRSTK
ncbi:MAG: transcriptional regulator MntR [Candidatus Sumerlaeaceae bacterium]